MPVECHFGVMHGVVTRTGKMAWICGHRSINMGFMLCMVYDWA